MLAVSRALGFFAVPLVVAQQSAPPVTDARSPFISVPAAASGALQFGAQLPEFEAKDTTGRIWQLADLRGKLTLIYVWNTFEARATDTLDPRARRSFRGLPDLSELQRFYDKASRQKNIQVLTFCSDHDYRHAHDYLQQTKYTFPVIADWVLVNKLFGGPSRQWLVNPEGRLSNPLSSWKLGSLLFEVEKSVAGN